MSIAHTYLAGGGVVRNALLAQAIHNGGAITCAYPLGGTLADVKQWNSSITVQPSLDSSQQIATYTAQGTMGGPIYFGVCPAGGHSTTQTIDLTSGKKSLRWNFSGTSGFGHIVADAQLQTPAGDFIQIEVQGSVVSVFTSIGAGVGTINTAVTPISTVDLMFDSGAGTFAVKVNGADLSLANNAYTSGHYTAIIQGHEESGYVGQAGSTAIIGLDTAPGDQAVWGAGVTDICGDPIGSSGTLSTIAYGPSVSVKDITDQAVAILNVSNGSGTLPTLDAKIQQSANGGSTWTDVPHCSFTQFGATGGVQQVVIRPGETTGLIRACVIVAGTNVDYLASMTILGLPK